MKQWNRDHVNLNYRFWNSNTYKKKKKNWGVGRPTGCCQLLRKMKMLRVIKKTTTNKQTNKQNKTKTLDTAHEVCHVGQCTVLHLILSRVISLLQKWRVSFSGVVTEDDCFWLRRCDRSTSSSSSIISSEPRLRKSQDAARKLKREMKSWLPMATDGHGHVLCHVPGH